MDADRFEMLLDRYQGGEATAEETAELEKLLRDEPTKRRRFVERVLLEVQLRKAFGSNLPMTRPVQTPARSLRRWFVPFAAMAATLLLTVSAFLAYQWSRPETLALELLAGNVTTGGQEAQRIAAGEWFEVVGASPAVLRLTDGSRAEFEPTSKALIQRDPGDARQAIELTQGGGKFQVVHGGGVFQVKTPVGNVTALGTAFSVKLQPQRKGKADAKGKLAMNVLVTEGSVRVDAGGKSQILGAGKNRVFGDDGQQNNRDDGEQNNQNNGKNEQGNKNNQNNDGKNEQGNQNNR
ncbi:MAG: hypothetical protein EXR98_16385 [Gemmataceae bacterium]|nr:hypothetical protein [Gemmataceae bacterium]